jgi:hypothetical protein
MEVTKTKSDSGEIKEVMQCKPISDQEFMEQILKRMREGKRGPQQERTIRRQRVMFV